MAEFCFSLRLLVLLGGGGCLRMDSSAAYGSLISYKFSLCSSTIHKQAKNLRIGLGNGGWLAEKGEF